MSKSAMIHHDGDINNEWAVFSAAVGSTLLNGLTLLTIYLALEPIVRRRRPEWLHSWNRLLEGRWRNALVGRDILLGLLLHGQLIKPARRQHV